MKRKDPRFAAFAEARAEILKTRRLQASFGLSVRTPTLAAAMRDQSLARCARHEAGHATVALAAGGTVWGVVAGEGASIVGVDGSVFLTASLRQGHHVERLAALGGYVADKTLSTSDFQMFFKGWFQDMHTRMTVADLFDQTIDQARALLRRHGGLHAALTARLLDVGFIDAVEIASIGRAHGIARRRPLLAERRIWSLHEEDFQKKVASVRKARGDDRKLPVKGSKTNSSKTNPPRGAPRTAPG